MKTMRRVLFWITLASMVAMVSLSSAVAEEKKPQKPAQWYMGAGYMSTTFDTDITPLTATLDDEDHGFKVFGGFRFNDYVGIEMTYANFGEASLKGNTGDTFAANGITYSFLRDNSSVTQKVWALSVGGVFFLPLDKVTGVKQLKWITPFGKIGSYYWDSDLEASNTSGSVSASDNGVDLFFGLGLDINLPRNFVIRGEWERYNGDDDIDAWSANLLFRF
ncbi:MAG: porin family protein [Desulfobacteraceae bacterium]|nr:porin family protein [Desulfobacteraceae bacterium]